MTTTIASLRAAYRAQKLDKAQVVALVAKEGLKLPPDFFEDAPSPAGALGGERQQFNAADGAANTGAARQAELRTQAATSTRPARTLPNPRPRRSRWGAWCSRSSRKRPTLSFTSTSSKDGPRSST